MAFMLVAVCAGYLLIPVSEDQISQGACDKIRIGMRLEETRQLLGSEDARSSWGNFRSENCYYINLHWRNEDGDCIHAVLDSNDGITWKSFTSAKCSAFERIKHRIERRIRALWP
jgi:hypothetical protein